MFGFCEQKGVLTSEQILRKECVCRIRVGGRNGFRSAVMSGSRDLKALAFRVRQGGPYESECIVTAAINTPRAVQAIVRSQFVRLSVPHAFASNPIANRLCCGTWRKAVDS